MGVRKKLWDLEEVREIYQNIEVQKNEDGIEELGFKDISITEKFIKNMSILSISYMDSKTKLSMQFLSDIIKKMYNQNLIKQKTANMIIFLKVLKNGKTPQKSMKVKTIKKINIVKV